MQKCSNYIGSTLYNLYIFLNPFRVRPSARWAGLLRRKHGRRCGEERRNYCSIILIFFTFLFFQNLYNTKIQETKLNRWVFEFVGEGGLFFSFGEMVRDGKRVRFICQFASLPLFLFSHYTRQHGHGRTGFWFIIYYLLVGTCWNGMEWNGMKWNGQRE